ncbi:MAG: phosphate/phosphite/phosphonate ABC transporter substrate-binding protein, partial [Gammaproteobacteria bacterium]|nr:phosphate/phosphite/phosphonate ABC transporter substrate-binding protein [Gammaproteobacteria bacterium]
AKPLITRDIDAEFTSVVMVNSKIQAKQLDDLKGRSFSFGSKLSTSGHLMPRYFFEQKKIIAESYFGKVIYSGAHDMTALMVSRGEVDAGVVNASIAQTMFEDGRLQRSKVKIIWNSPQYQDYVWAVQPDMDERVRYKIRDAFLALNSETETGRQVLSNLEANYFIPVSSSDYEMLENILDNLAVSD